MEAGAILVKRGLLSSQQLDQLRRERPDAARLDMAAVDTGLVTEEAALRGLGDEVGIPFVDLEQQEIDLSLLRGFPQKLIHRHALFPLQRHNGSLRSATSDPFDLYPLDELSVTTGLTIEPVLAPAPKSPSRSRRTSASAAKRSTACWPSRTTKKTSNCSKRSTTARSSPKPKKPRSSGW